MCERLTSRGKLPVLHKTRHDRTNLPLHDGSGRALLGDAALEELGADLHDQRILFHVQVHDMSSFGSRIRSYSGGPQYKTLLVSRAAMEQELNTLLAGILLLSVSQRPPLAGVYSYTCVCGL